VKFETTPAFDTDFRRLKGDFKKAFGSVVRDSFAPACDQFASTPGYVWPAALRVSRMQGTSGIWEITWLFASPDGRATFEFVRRDGELICRWRRVGDHSVFKHP
jgi:hypothetical protein